MTEDVAIQRYVGTGLYTPREAARLARVTSEAICRWVFGDNGHEAVVRASLSEERIISFRNLVEAMSIHSARSQTRVSLQGIRKSVENAERVWHRQHVLARRHRMFRWGDMLLIEFDDGTMVGASRGVRNQRFMPEVVKDYLKPVRDHSAVEVVQSHQRKLTFGEDGLACAWEVLRGEDGMSVVLDRRLRFGQPVVQPFGITARTLVDAVAGEGSVEAAAAMYEVPAGAVHLAFEFSNLYARAA